MSVEKYLVANFQILENKGLMGIELETDGEPVNSASFLYDGRNCAVLICNNSKAFVLLNIAYDLRPKILNANPLLIIETKNNQAVNLFGVEVTKVEALPYPDEFDNVLTEILQQIRDKYGDKAIDTMIEKFWPEDAPENKK